MEKENYKPDKTEKSEEEALAEYKEFLKNDGKPEANFPGSLSEEDLKEAAKSESMKDKQFNKFRKRIEYEPEQVQINKESM